MTRYAIEGRICLHSTPEGGLLVNARRTQTQQEKPVKNRQNIQLIKSLKPSEFAKFKLLRTPNPDRVGEVRN